MLRQLLHLVGCLMCLRCCHAASLVLSYSSWSFGLYTELPMLDPVKPFHASCMMTSCCPCQAGDATAQPHSCRQHSPAAGASTSGFKTVQTQPATQGCRADVQDLMPGTQYFFQVYAVNNQGASPASSTGQPMNNSCTCFS